ncbi:MAG TPA: RNA 2',3'-cyclic phosphodiesterase [Myxococcota bacterium]|nr:RNA 2',3'-cyclic phosphodiesterase [Myxococcota bacterium]
MRAFLAIDLGSEARAAAAAIAAALRALPNGDAVGWVRAENYHVTLRFLGEIDPARVARLAGCVREQTAALRPFRLELGGAHAFPSRRRPTALVLDVGPSGPLEALAEAVERGVVAAGFEPEARAFRAHLTLGRLHGARFPAVTGTVTSGGESCAVDEVVLFKSELQPSGASYTAIERTPLGGEPSPLSTQTDGSIYNPNVGG